MLLVELRSRHFEGIDAYLSREEKDTGSFFILCTSVFRFGRRIILLPLIDHADALSGLPVRNCFIPRLDTGTYSLLLLSRDSNNRPSDKFFIVLIFRLTVVRPRPIIQLGIQLN